MKRESDNKETVVKKPRASTPSSDESEELLDDSGVENEVSGSSGVENENQENPRLHDFLGLNVERASVNLNEATVEVEVREGTEQSEVVENLSGGAGEGDDGAGGSRAETEAMMDEMLARGLMLLAHSRVPRELEPRADHQKSPLNRLRVSVWNTYYRRSELRRMGASLERWKERRSEEAGNLDANPFSAALANIKGQKKMSVAWSPSRRGRPKRFLCQAPSLLELSMKELAKNADAIVSLEGVPFILRKRLAHMVCSLWGMNSKALELFVGRSPTEICIKDCSWLTLYHISKAFRNIDVSNLEVLQLEHCEQCNFDYLVDQIVAKPLTSLRNLAILSLKGASRLTDNAVKALLIAAPALKSINLSQCALLTKESINFIADAIGPTLKELYIDECQSINAMLIEATLLKFKRLEVLSVARIPTVRDILVEGVVSVCGKTLKELNLAECQLVTNDSFEVIASTCSNLQALNISNLYQLTDISLEYLANGCQSIQSLTLNGNRFSDEVIAAFLKTSGMSMKNLSLNKVSQVGYYTMMSLANHSRGLLCLDLSGCHRVSNKGLGLIVDRCLSLRLLKLFGCTQITDMFLNGHSNTQVQIVGPTNTPLRTYMNDLKPEELLLRYSEI